MCSIVDVDVLCFFRLRLRYILALQELQVRVPLSSLDGLSRLRPRPVRRSLDPCTATTWERLKLKDRGHVY